MLNLVKIALRITSSAFDAELLQLISAATADLALAGVIIPDNPEEDALIARAICTYCAMQRISIDPQQRTWLKASYDEQKAQMQTATGHTEWGGADEG